MSLIDGKTHCEFCNHVAKEVSALRHEVSWYKKKLEQSQLERYRLERELGRREPTMVTDNAELTNPTLEIEVEPILAIPCGRSCGAACG